MTGKRSALIVPEALNHISGIDDISNVIIIDQLPYLLDVTRNQNR